MNDALQSVEKTGLIDDGLDTDRCPNWWKPLAPKTPFFSAPQISVEKPTRGEILEHLKKTWGITEILFTALKSESAFLRPPTHQLRHPLIFYYGHPAVLYVNKLRVAGILKSGVNEPFEKIFEVGVDEMSWDDMSKNEMKWPSLDEVIEYRRQVFHLLKTLIMEHPAFDASQAPFLSHTAAWALFMGFEHERIHIETSAVLIRELPIEHVQRPASWPALPKSTTNEIPTSWISVPTQKVTLGKKEQTPYFGWDNEYGNETVEVPNFEVSQHLISNRDFHEFVQQGGYREARHWSKDGWGWKTFRNVKWPTFWIPKGPEGLHEYRLRSTFEIIDMPWNFPVIVNGHEAEAYGRWRSEKDRVKSPYQLPSEAQQMAMRKISANSQEWNHELRFGSEGPVDQWMDEKSRIADVYGNLWQWSRDEFRPLNGFKIHPYYEDFSTPCFDGLHQMIFGGSFISTGDEAGPWARFHFRPHFFQNAGIRLVKASSAIKVEAKTGTQSTVTKSSASRGSLQDYKKSFSRTKNWVHLNNAGLAPICIPADETIQYWSGRFRDEGMHCNDDYLAAVEGARGTLARFLHCASGEIAFFQSTAGAISQMAFAVPLKTDDEVLMWDQEYASNLYPWSAACQRRGAKLVFAASEPNFTTPVEKLIEKISAKTKVIAISWVQFQTGAITELEELAKIARQKDIWLIVDVIQGAGLFPFDFKKLGVDAVAGGSHKWLTSPVGVGYLAVRSDRVAQLQPLMVGSGTYGTCDDPADLNCRPKTDALKFEAGSKQVLEILALEASLKNIMAVGVETLCAETEKLSLQLLQGLSELGLLLHQKSRHRGSIVNLRHSAGVEKTLKNHKISYALRGVAFVCRPTHLIPRKRFSGCLT